MGEITTASKEDTVAKAGQDVVHYIPGEHAITGEATMTFCGLPHENSEPQPRGDIDLVEVVGGLIPIPKTKDCPDCVRIYSLLAEHLQHAANL